MIRASYCGFGSINYPPGWVESTKISNAILAARQAFDDFGSWAKLHSKVEQTHKVFQPYNRGFCIPLKKESFCWSFVSLVGKGSPDLHITKKIEWDDGNYHCTFIN